MQDLWLLKLDELDRPNDAFVSGLRRLAPDVQSWQSMEGELTYVYMPGHMLPIAVTPSHCADWHRLVCLQEINGASARQIASYHYVVETDVLPEYEEDLNSWYAQEHLPGLAAVSGTVRATRYIDAGSSPRYYACYDLANLDTLGSPAWLAVRGTPWSSRVRPAFRNTRRTMFRRATAPAT